LNLRLTSDRKTRQVRIRFFDRRRQVITTRNAITGDDSTKRVPIAWRRVSGAEENNRRR